MPPLRPTLALWLALSACAGEPAPAPPAVPAPAPRATIDGVPVDAGRFGPLVAAREDAWEDVALHALLERAAARDGLALDPAELEAMVAAAEAQLPAEGLGPAARSANARLAAESQLFVAELVRSRRAIGEDDVRALFEMRHGPGGVRTEVRRILLTKRRMRLLLERRGVAEEELDEARVEAEIEALGRDLVRRIEAGESFEDLAKREGHELLAQRTGGLMEGESWRALGADLVRAVEEAPVGAVLGPIETRLGWNVFRVESRTETELDDALADELRAALRAMPPTPREVHELLAELESSADVRYDGDGR